MISMLHVRKTIQDDRQPGTGWGYYRPVQSGCFGGGGSFPVLLPGDPSDHLANFQLVCSWLLECSSFDAIVGTPSSPCGRALGALLDLPEAEQLQCIKLYHSAAVWLRCTALHVAGATATGLLQPLTTSDPLALLVLCDAMSADGVRAVAKRASAGPACEGLQHTELAEALENWACEGGNSLNSARAKALTRHAVAVAGTTIAVKSATARAAAAGSTVVVRLSDALCEALHRIYVYFFTSAGHSPQDAATLLGFNMARLRFSCSPAVQSAAAQAQTEQPAGAFGDAASSDTDEQQLQQQQQQQQQYTLADAPFEDLYRRVRVSDAMELAGAAGDASMAYRLLHEESSALLPQACVLCCSNGNSTLSRTQSTAGMAVSRVVSAPPDCHTDADAKAAAAAATDTAADSADAGGSSVDNIGDSSNSSSSPCPLCLLSAATVRRGVGLLEREQKYEEALHYLGLQLQAPGLRLSPHRPKDWLRTLVDRSHMNR
jgi:hypothetical protein